MAKRITVILLLLALAVGLYAVTANATGAPVPTQTAQPTAKPSQTVQKLTITNICTVTTGVSNGTVNLRTCAGTSCAVLDILTEGESLTIVTAGLWTQVTNKDGVTGYINSKYCKGK